MKGINIGCASSKIKYGNRLDTSIVEIDSNACISGLFTSNNFKSAPVQICIKKLNKGIKGKKILAINAGNANAGTGSQGIKDAETLISQLSKNLKVKPENILPFSTGVVGELLDVEALKKAFNTSFNNLGTNSWRDLADAIMTTDTKKKLITFKGKIGSKKYSIVGIAKGVGMIEPNMATTLSYVFTDLKIPEKTLKKIHKRICDLSFNALSIDGDQSPSDSSILVATGASKIKVTNNENKIEKELLNVFSGLAKKLILDGEGATKLINICVKGLPSKNLCEVVARKVANSSLVKTAAYGEDPNWGRIIVAAGNSEIRNFDINQLTLKIGKTSVFKNGSLAKGYKESQGKKEFKKKTIDIEISLGKTKNFFNVITSDLSHEYVSINSDYRS